MIRNENMKFYSILSVQIQNLSSALSQSSLRGTKNRHILSEISNVFTIYLHVADNERRGVRVVTNLSRVRRIRDRNWVSCGLNASCSDRDPSRLVCGLARVFRRAETPLSFLSPRADPYVNSWPMWSNGTACGSRVNFKYTA